MEANINLDYFYEYKYRYSFEFEFGYKVAFLKIGGISNQEGRSLLL
jgi:hypothetical protein